jgi:hypothetical protein
MQKSKQYRIIILGAGFSRLAGLPLGLDLFPEIRKRAIAEFGQDNFLEEDLINFIDYKTRCDGIKLSAEMIDFEEFLSYLDIEHFLGLRGKHTWSSQGNEGQIIVKRLIGKIIQERTPKSSSLPTAYLRFAELLAPSDIIVTFNYDVILERALDHIGKSYRLFPDRFTEVGNMVNIIDDSHDEVIILKMHGSVDWFSRKDFDAMQSSYRRQRFSLTPKDPIFEDPKRYNAKPILDGPQAVDNPLAGIYRIGHVDAFYSPSYPPATPWLLSPSASKIVYSSPMRDFWYGMGFAGAWQLAFSIIGFSMPLHDEYVKQSIYSMVRNFQESDNVESLGYKKSKLKIVDFRLNEEEAKNLKQRFRFVDWSNTELWLKGFDNDAVTFLFKNEE